MGQDWAQEEELTAHSIGQNRVHRRPGTVLRCKQCGHGFRGSRPDPELLASLYREQDVETYLSEVPGRRWTATRHWDLVKPLMQRGHVLDVGCASGLFLERVREAGWRATGIEPSSTLCRYARERLGEPVEIECGTLEFTKLPQNSFDVVTLWDVLEHAPDPGDFLRASSGLLKSGGYLLLNVPHLDSVMARLLGSRWPLLLPEHLHYFSRDSLLRCGSSAGLSWERFDSRRAYYSMGHIAARLAEHEVPMAAAFRSLFGKLEIENWVIPVPLGEIVSVFRKSII